MARPMTMAEKILAAHAGLEEVVPGQLIECDLDLVLSNDVTSPSQLKNSTRLALRRFLILRKSHLCQIIMSLIKILQQPSKQK